MGVFEVTGTLLGATGKPITGAVRFVPDGPSDAIGVETVEVEVTGNGELSVELAGVEPNDPSPAVTSWEMRIKGRPPVTVPCFVLDPRYPPPALDLGELVPGWASSDS